LAPHELHFIIPVSYRMRLKKSFIRSSNDEDVCGLPCHPG
jgi:hypothetical protein